MHERPFYAAVSSHNATRFHLSVVRDVLVGPHEIRPPEVKDLHWRLDRRDVVGDSVEHQGHART